MRSRIGGRAEISGGKRQDITNSCVVTLWETQYDSMSDLGEIRVYQRADFQSGSRVLKKVF